MAILMTVSRTEKYEYLCKKFQPILMFETVLCLKSLDNFSNIYYQKYNNYRLTK